MRIISAGLIRSGSTWQFNCLRVIMKQADLDPSSFWVNDYDNEQGNVLIKAHEYFGGLSDGSKVFTCERPEAEVLGSMRRRAAYLKENPDPRFNGTANVDRYPKYYRWFRLWRAHSVYNMQYSELLDNPLKVIDDHIKALGLTGRVHSDLILQELNNIKLPVDGWDASTFYHAGHITNP